MAVFLDQGLDTEVDRRAVSDGYAPLCVLLKNMQRFYTKKRLEANLGVQPLFYCSTNPNPALTKEQVNELIEQATPLFVGRPEFEGSTWTCSEGDQPLATPDSLDDLGGVPFRAARLDGKVAGKGPDTLTTTRV